MACASTVAVVVPSPAVSDVLLATSRTIWAPMFSSGSFSSISLATVTPSLVINGEPNFLSRTTLRPLGPNVTFTTSASLLIPRKSAWRLCSPWTICFAFAMFISSRDLLRPIPSFGTASDWIFFFAASRPAGQATEPALLLPARRRVFGGLDHAQHLLLAQDQ